MKAFYRLLYYISILLTGILAGFTLTGAFAENSLPEDSMIMPFLGLALPILLIANLISLLYWAIRWRCWVFIPLIAILGNGAYITRILQFPLFDSASKPRIEVRGTHSSPNDSATHSNNLTTEPHSNNPTTATHSNNSTSATHPNILTLATYNVNSFNREHTGFSCKAIAAHMKNLGVDLFCFQEFGINNEFGIDSICHALAEWPYHYIPTSPAGESLLQLAVFSRYPIKDEQLITYPASNNCSLQCDIDVNGKTIRLFNNHLQTTEVSRNKRKLEKELLADDTERAERAAITLANGLHENFKKRAEQANHLHQLVTASPHPTLVCGDFNSLPSSYTYATVKGNKLNDGFQTSGHGYMYTFRYFKHLLRIDYIFHSKEIKGVDYFSPDLVYSDHNPVVMRMEI